MEFNREFSHTILHKFNVFKSKKEDIFENRDILTSNHKPIIKRDNVKKKDSRFEKNDIKESRDKELGGRDYYKEKEIKEKDIDILKRNLMRDATPRSEDRKAGLIINPGHAIENKKNVKSSLEIDVNRTPKIEHLKNSDSNRNEKRKDNYENKKNVEKNIRRNIISRKSENVSTNISSKESDSNVTERRKSGSKSSQEENKERNSALREFMKKMKDDIKSTPQNDINVLWQKGIDVSEQKEQKEKFSRKNSDREVRDIKIDIRDAVKEKEKEKELLNINININTPKITDMYNNQNKNPKYKDLKEYLETQKMLVELERLQNEDLDEQSQEEEEDNIDDLINEFKSLDEEQLMNMDKDECEDEEIIQVVYINNSLI
jgi:hypothetical protein